LKFKRTAMLDEVAKLRSDLMTAVMWNEWILSTVAKEGLQSLVLR
jgi:hypothetical protein